MGAAAKGEGQAVSWPGTYCLRGGAWGEGPRLGPPWVLEVTGHLIAISPDFPFRFRAFLFSYCLCPLFLLPSEAKAEPVWVMGWGN